MGIWARLKQAVDRVAPDSAEWPPRQEPEPQPAGMDGYSDIVASELIDGTTCTRCAEIDGHEYASLASARADYPAGEGYKHCENESGCRGSLLLMRED